MVSFEQIEQVERFMEEQRNLPFAERVRVRSVKHILTVMTYDDAELSRHREHEEAWPNLFRFARLLRRLRANAQELLTGDAVDPFEGCESRPAFSTLTVEVGCALLFCLRSVLDEHNEREQAFYAEVEELSRHLQTLVNACRARRRPGNRICIPTWINQLDQFRDSLLRQLA